MKTRWCPSPAVLCFALPTAAFNCNFLFLPPKNKSCAEEGYITHKSWRPLITLMYAAEWVLCGRWGFAGAEMRPMRLVSCLVHSLNAGLVLAVLRRVGEHCEPSFFLQG